MTDIIQYRLYNQRLWAHSCSNPVDIVRHMLCMQAQDFTQAKRAIASRCGCSQEDVEQAFNSWQLVRTWTQRGTIHVVSAEDAWWMTRLCASKTLWWFKKRREYLGIKDTQIDEMLEALPLLLIHGPMSRKAIATALSTQGFDLSENKPYHLMCYAGTLWITVQWPIINWEHRFVLSSQWIKNPKKLTEEASLKELCLRYFASHGPATVQDLQWRSGIGKTQINQGISLCGDELIQQEIDGKTYYFKDSRVAQLSVSRVHFLAGFDEFLLGYKDRTATLDLDHHKLVDKARNGVFKPTVMMGGKTVGIWSMKEKIKHCEVMINFFDEYDIPKKELERWVKEFERYMGKEIKTL